MAVKVLVVEDDVWGVVLLDGHGSGVILIDGMM